MRSCIILQDKEQNNRLKLKKVPWAISDAGGGFKRRVNSLHELYDNSALCL